MVRFAKLDDTHKLMKFIAENWRPNHILARDENFFRYFLQDGDRLNWVISEVNGEIDAVLNFIPYGKKHRDICNCMWKANHDNGDPVIGLKLLDFLRKKNYVKPEYQSADHSDLSVSRHSYGQDEALVPLERQLRL